jgi:hypothetical protein
MKKITKTQSVLGVIAVAVGFTLMSFAPAAAGYKIGDQVADFKLKNSVNDKTVSMADYPNAKGYVVMFTCNHCPFAKKYEQRIMDIDKKYASLGYPTIAISPNDPAIDRMIHIRRWLNWLRRRNILSHMHLMRRRR